MFALRPSTVLLINARSGHVSVTYTLRIQSTFRAAPLSASEFGILRYHLSAYFAGVAISGLGFGLLLIVARKCCESWCHIDAGRCSPYVPRSATLTPNERREDGANYQNHNETFPEIGLFVYLLFIAFASPLHHATITTRSYYICIPIG